MNPEIMKRRQSSDRDPAMARAIILGALAILPLLSAGCNNADPRGGGAPLKGKPSDPPVALVARWDETNAYVYHLESITGTEVPRRNSTVVIQQDTTLAKDFRFGVTNILRDGVRSMSMEIQSVRVDTTSDQRLTSAFDTENELLSTEDNTIASRLRRVKGARLGFKLAPVPSCRVVRVDGGKEFNDRVGSGRNVRGAAGAVINKFFNQQFYRDLVEMSFLPTNPVRVGDSWTVTQRSGPGLYDVNGAPLTYTFRGWQVREGTNCARLDFTGTTKAASGSTNKGREEIEINGAIWFSNDLGVPVEISYDQAIVRHTTTTTRTGRAPGSNAPPGAVTLTRPLTASAAPGAPAVHPPGAPAEADDEPEPPAPGGGTPPPAPSSPNAATTTTTTTTSRTTNIKQHVTLTLVELVPVELPATAVHATQTGSTQSGSPNPTLP